MSSYINSRAVSASPWGGLDAYEAHNWEEFTLARLAWLYGPERAKQIHQGNDPKTQADLAAWRKLGRRSAA